MVPNAPTLIVIALMATQAFAQSADVPDAPPVQQLIERALSRAPSLAAQRARLASVELGAKAADALPDPMVEFEYRAGAFPRYTIGSDPGSMLGASVRQDLLSKGRRAARRDTAAAGVAQRRVERDALAARLVTSVQELYARLFVIDREAETLGDAQQLLRLLEATASARYASGDADQASVLRVQLERTGLGERLTDLTADRLMAQADLDRLMDDPPDHAIGRVRALPPMPGLAALSSRTPDALMAAAAEHAPDVALRLADVDVAGRRVAEARQDLGRAWSVGAGLYWQGGLDRMATFSVGVELPFWKARKQQPLIAAAERELDATRAEAADTAADVRAEAARQLIAWQAAGDQIERYRSAILPQNTAALDATRSSYLAGRGDFVSVLDEFRRWIDVRVGLAKREADRFIAAARLETLINPAPAPAAK